MIQVKDVVKIYKNGSAQVTALDHISINFPKKGLVFIVGKSGAGKTTLLNILGGLDFSTSGELFINGQSTKNFKASDYDNLRNHTIGFIFQDFNLLDDLTVYDNIAIALKIQSKGHDITAIDEVLKIVNLEGLGYRRISELSGGQKQRIAIARALVKNPNIIIADEPTGALDSKTSYELLESLKKLSEDKLVIVATHDEEMAHYFANQIIRLNDGKVVSRIIRKKELSDQNIKKYNGNIIKIKSGFKLEDANIINENLDANQDNAICITSTPEEFTSAYPELYDDIFEEIDYASQFEPYQEKEEQIENNQTKYEKSYLKTKECFKMARNSYSKKIGRVIFLLLFTILSISLLGTSISMLGINNAMITAKALKNNNIDIGILRKDNNADIIDDDVVDLKKLNEDISFALGKSATIPYKQVVEANSSPFAMKNFTGVVECQNIASLNLKTLYGVGSFNSSSLANDEIIISDYAAYEMARTGYIGHKNGGSLEVIKPESLSEIVNTSVNIGDYSYKIIGIFDTNYEDYLSLLVDQTYNSDQENQESALSVLKNYYYARIFAPTGFYRKLYLENSRVIQHDYYTVYSTTVEIYDSEEEKFAPSKSRVVYADFDEFHNDYDNYSYSSAIWGQVPSNPSGLRGNQIILNARWLSDYGVDITSSSEVNRFVETLNTMYIYKLDSLQNNASSVYEDNLEVVGVAYFNSSAAPYIFFSSEYTDKFNETRFNYNQVFFTLRGGLYNYKRIIDRMEKANYRALNVDGSIAYSTATIDSYKTLALAIGIVFTLFSFFIILSFANSTVRLRGKEIGILRATGARKFDIFKIFAVEEGILAVIIAIVSSVISLYLCRLLNVIFGNPALGIELVVFDFLSVFYIILITFILIGIATMIPVFKIASLKPMDAIRKE